MSGDPSEVAAIVLAAGQGTRFGAEPKLLASLDGKPLVRHVVEAALAAGLGEVIVVVGHRAAEVRAALADLRLRFVDNPAFAGGLSTSLKAGFAALNPADRAAIVLLGDMPRVTPALIRLLAQAWGSGGHPDAVIPTLAGQRGNPVLIDRRLASDVAALRGDVGAGPLLRGRAVLEVLVDDPAVRLDIDTPEALRDLSSGGLDVATL